MSYDDFAAGKWKPYDQLTPDNEPDTCNVKYDGIEFTIKTKDKEVNQIIKKDVFMMNIDKQAAKFSKAGDTSSAAYVKWKDELSRDLVKDPAGIVAFYLINKYIGDKPLFDPLDKKDFKIIGAVTNAFANFRPNDPRTSYMVDNFKVGLSQRRSESAPRDTLVATEASLIDIKLMDQHGKMQSL